MSLVATSGVWMPYPQIQLPVSFTNSVIDATGEKFAWIGRVWNKDRTTKNITKVGFRLGTVTKAGGSAMTVSLQDVSLTAGPGYQPDEVQDQTVAIANADAGFVTNTWYQTNAFSAARTVAFGELLAVVIEYDGAGRLGADAVNLSNALIVSNNMFQASGITLKTAGWVTVSTALPNIILEFDDGTFGTLSESYPTSNISSIAYNSGSAADEVALEFTLPFPCRVDGMFVLMQAAAGADFDMVLYDGTTPIATVSTDQNSINASASNRIMSVTFPEVALTAGATYRLSMKPTTANNVTMQYFEVANANHMQALPGGTSWTYTTRVDGGAWDAPTTTRRPWAGIRISALDDGASAGGGISRARAAGGF